MRRFTSAAQLQRFASVHGIVQNVNRREIVTPDRRQILTPYSRCLKRQESFPVSMISQ